jgi:uncharacterized protein Yka (UPF0111/DUF47 family)
MDAKDLTDIEELLPQIKGALKRAFKKYAEATNFLEEMDEKYPGGTSKMNSIEEIETYEAAVVSYELLHEILGIEGEPKWCS